MNRLLTLLPVLATALAGCASHAPQASGPYRALNPGRWQATPDDLRGVRAPQSPASSPVHSPALTPSEVRP